MTTKGKVIVTISALVIVAGASYLIYKYIKNSKGDKGNTNSNGSTDVPSPDSGNGNTNVPVPEPNVSKYGFTPGEKLYITKDYTGIYKLPTLADDKRVGYLNREAVSKVRFVSDSSTPGWVKVNAVNLTNDSFQKTEKKEVRTNGGFILANRLTKIEP